MVVHTFDLSMQRRVDLWVPGQPDLPRDLQDSQGYVKTPSQKTKVRGTKSARVI